MKVTEAGDMPNPALTFLKACPVACHTANAASTGSEPITFFFFFGFLGPHLWHMEVPRLGVDSAL